MRIAGASDGGVGGADAGEVPLDCEPNSVVCESDVLTECNAEGDGAFLTDCPAGCNGVEPRCNRVVPSNGIGQFLDQAKAAGDLVIPDGATLRSDGTLTDSEGVDIPIASEDLDGLRVFLVRNLTFDGDATVAGPAPIAILTAGPVVVLGSVTITPNGRDCITDVRPDPVQAHGTPGGSFGGAGGNGGASKDNPSPPSNNATTLAFEPLRSGCDGGDFPGTFVEARGGGALQVTSIHSIEFVGGHITASGEGGRAFPPQTDPGGEDFGGAGGGGGSGGTILIEAPQVSFVGASGLASNGGGGGCANDDGARGEFETARAAGASCGGSTSGDGGLGGSAAGPATSGGAGSAIGGGGGGGGGAGFVGIRTVDTPDLSGSTVISPVAIQSSLATE